MLCTVTKRSPHWQDTCRNETANICHEVNKHPKAKAFRVPLIKVQPLPSPLLKGEGGEGKSSAADVKEDD